SFPVTANNCVTNVSAPQFANPNVTLNTNFSFSSINSLTLSNTSISFAASSVSIGSVNPCSTAPVIINQYAALPARPTDCDNSFTVDDASGFHAGDTVLMIQMKGATIDTSNTASFGSVLNYNGAGNYEFNTIKSVSGNTITLFYQVKRNYDIPGGL